MSVPTTSISSVSSSVPHAALWKSYTNVLELHPLSHQLHDNLNARSFAGRNHSIWVSPRTRSLLQRRLLWNILNSIPNVHSHLFYLSGINVHKNGFYVFLVFCPVLHQPCLFLSHKAQWDVYVLFMKLICICLLSEMFQMNSSQKSLTQHKPVWKSLQLC